MKFIYDIENSTFFSIANNYLYSFKDKNGNLWSTIPESFNLVGNCYSPLGSEFESNDGITIIFTTKEEVIKLATAYFEKFIEKDYGLEKKINNEFFFYEGVKYMRKYHKFKLRMQNEIDIFLSNN